MRRIHSFAVRHPLTGPLVWVLSIQYFVVQIVVAFAWNPPYSWRLDAISDLGATTCGQFDGRHVCSPLARTHERVIDPARPDHGHRVGAQLPKIPPESRRVLPDGGGRRRSDAGRPFPEDTVYGAHVAGADLAFLLGNIALVIFGATLRAPRWFTRYTSASGVVPLVALGLFLSHNRFFL